MTSLFKKRQPKHVSAAFCSVSEVEQHLADSEFNIGKIQEIQNKFAGGEILQVPGRVFVREGTLVKVCRKGPKKRQFFLFNDVLVYGCILPKNRYGNQHILPLSQMSVSDTCHYLPSIDYKGSGDDQLEEELAFQLNHTDKSFHVFANSVADKNNWITNLRKNIAKATQGKDDNPLIVRAVWVPDSMTTGCMQCDQKFTTFIRKHHCRQCGKVVCSSCSQNRLELRQRVHVADPTNKPERVCDNCYASLTQRQEHDQPPPPAATVVSKALLKQAGPHPSNHHDNNSEESEDSDDSETEDNPSAKDNPSTAKDNPSTLKDNPSTAKESTTDKRSPEVAKITTAMDKSAIEEPTPPPRRKKEQKSVKKPPVVARTKKDFSQLHHDFAPSELLEQKKLSDVTMVISDEPNESHDPEKPRRKRRHFKSPDHVSHGNVQDHVSHDNIQDHVSHDNVQDDVSHGNVQDHVSHGNVQDHVSHGNVDNKEQITSREEISDDVTSEQLTITNSELVTDDVVDNDITNVTEDHVIPNDQGIPDDQPHTQSITDSPVTSRRKRKNKFKPKE